MQANQRIVSCKANTLDNKEIVPKEYKRVCMQLGGSESGMQIEVNR